MSRCIFLKVILLFMIGIFVFTGCKNKTGKIFHSIAINDYNGVYQKGDNTFYIVAINKDTLKYYVVDKQGDKNYGELEYINGVAIENDFGETVELKLTNGNLEVKTKNVSDFSDGIYKKINECTLDDYFENNYGLKEYLNSDYSGKFVNNDDYIYMYQPIKNYIEIYAEMNNKFLTCDVDLSEQDSLYCDVLGTRYDFIVDNNKISFQEQSDDKIIYEGVFTKNTDLNIKDVIDVFAPFYKFANENNSR